MTVTSGDLESHTEFLSRMIILEILVENKFLKLFLKLECHHNYRVLTHVCLSVELLSLNKITQECYKDLTSN